MLLRRCGRRGQPFGSAAWTTATAVPAGRGEQPAERGTPEAFAGERGRLKWLLTPFQLYALRETSFGHESSL